jgi:hypothetical protein
MIGQVEEGKIAGKEGREDQNRREGKIMNLERKKERSSGKN